VVGEEAGVSEEAGAESTVTGETDVAVQAAVGVAEVKEAPCDPAVVKSPGLTAMEAVVAAHAAGPTALNPHKPAQTSPMEANLVT